MTQTMQWRTPEQEEPPYDEMVITTDINDKHKIIVMGRLTHKTISKSRISYSWEDRQFNPIEVTHWMPLPTPPTKETRNDLNTTQP